ncbi:C-type lectin mosGCTL-1-like [Glandiceps talaboti]
MADQGEESEFVQILSTLAALNQKVDTIQALEHKLNELQNSVEYRKCNRPYYAKASQFCSEEYDGLVRLESAQEQDAVVGYIQANGLDNNACIPGKGFWIGLDDKRSEGDYVWLGNTIRQSLCSSGYSNWTSGEPNNNVKENALGQDCVQLWFRGTRYGQWDDEYCDYRPKGAVCEQRVPNCDYAAYDINDAQIPDC